MNRLPSPPEVSVVRLVRVGFLRGAGEAPDPVRQVIRYYDLAGELVAEVDPSARIAYPNDGGSLIPDALRARLADDAWDPRKPGI